MEKCKDCIFLKKIPINSIINFLQCVNPNKNDCIKRNRTMSKVEDLAKEFLKKLVSHTTLYKGTIDELEVYEPDDVIWAYKEGYHQAEKDLDVVSWVKEVSGVKELSRAKEEALKAYPPQSIAANYDTINRRDAFEYGYLKAEKDLELTWEDISYIVKTYSKIECDKNYKWVSFSEACKETLNRFNKQKEDGKI